MDAGIIRSLKYHYRYILASKRLQASEDSTTLEWNILDVIIGIKSAWASVKQQTIQNCYRKAGFEKYPDQPSDTDDDAMEDETHLRIIWDALRTQYGDAMCDMETYVSIDDDAPVSAELTDEEIVESIKKPESVTEDGSADDNDEAETEVNNGTPVTLNEAYKAVRNLRLYGLRYELDVEELTDKLDNALGLVVQNSCYLSGPLNLTSGYLRG